MVEGKGVFLFRIKWKQGKGSGSFELRWTELVAGWLADWLALGSGYQGGSD